MTPDARMEFAERQLVMIQSFFPRIDSKVTAIFAIVSSQMAIVAINLTTSDLRSALVVVPLILFSAGTLGVAYNLYHCTYPHLDGVVRSLVYFDEIAKRDREDFRAAYTTASAQALLDDYTTQIWRNSEILKIKYGYLRTATIVASLGTACWILTLFGISVQNGRLPALAS